MTSIEIYPIPNSPRLKIEPSKKARGWMSPHAYRCLPIGAANAFGWDIILTEEVSFWWSGGSKPEDLKIIGDGGHIAQSHFGGGTVTFPVGYTWKTEPGVQLMVGPHLNDDKFFFHTISAIVETDVLQYPWFLTIRATRPGDTILAAGTILGTVYPVRLTDVTEATIRELPEPEDYRLARAEHTNVRNRANEEDPKRWLRFYHEKVNHRAVRAPKVQVVVDDGGEVDFLAQNGIMARSDWLTKEEAAEIAAYAKVAPLRPQDTELWAGRVFDFNKDDFSPALYEKLTAKVHEAVARFYGKKMEMEHPHIVRWGPGDMMLPHSDHSQGKFPHRDYAVVIYLTDDYKGGNIFMPSLGLDLSPEAGDLIAFNGGEIFHGVREVTEGLRYTCITWLKDLGPA